MTTLRNPSSVLRERERERDLSRFRLLNSAAMAATTCTLMCGAAAAAGSLEGAKLRNVFEAPQQVPRRCGVVVRAAKGGKEKGDEEERKEDKKSLFTSLTDALDFAQVRSEKDAELLYDARQATKSGEKMTREQVRHEIFATIRVKGKEVHLFLTCAQVNMRELRVAPRCFWIDFQVCRTSKLELNLCLAGPTHMNYDAVSKFVT